ncbi:MAG: O-acetylhomoserine aminocarboxypropyltransferase/cysteine synthase [Spirochaetales bacterium]|nr:O-acetylhomoserine aminocarboxypropyltransferase/cysteine synthase [Spirochaetales bacterium]
MNKQHIETKCIQSGYKPRSGEPRVTPIAQSTTFFYETAQEAADLFDLKANGHMYSRISNPTVEVLEKKVADLEGGVGAVATSSGQAANLISILNITRAGQHILVSSFIYGGTFSLIDNTIRKMGIDISFFNPSQSEEEILKLARPETRLIFAETLTNPGTDVLDIEKISKIAKELDVPLIVDNTFPTPILCKPFEFGANIVTHSSTKYMDGHATSVGGVIVDGGNFNWENGKYPELTEEDKSYHGVVYTKDFGKAAYVTKARTQYIRDFGSYLSPMNAFLTNKGIETLHLRMERHSTNALYLAEFLQTHEKVSWVKYPFLKSDTNYELAQKYLKAGSGVLTFGVKGGRKAGIKLMDALELAAIVVHVADVRTCVLHPASMTHRQLSDQQLQEAGVSADLIRVSVGIENIEDIIQDFNQALNSL